MYVCVERKRERRESERDLDFDLAIYIDQYKNKLLDIDRHTDIDRYIHVMDR